MQIIYPFGFNFGNKQSRYLVTSLLATIPPFKNRKISRSTELFGKGLCKASQHNEKSTYF